MKKRLCKCEHVDTLYDGYCFDCIMKMVMNHEITISRAGEMMGVSVERVRKWIRE